MSINEEYNLNLPGERTKVVSARFWKRAVAFGLDLFLVYALILGQLGRFFTATTFQESLVQVQSMHFGLLNVIIGTIGLILLLYFSLFQLWLGQTIGMRLVGISVQVPNFWTAIVRNIFVIPIFPFSILWIVELFYLFSTKERWLARITKTPTTERIEY